MSNTKQQGAKNPQGKGQSSVERFVRSSSDVFLDIPSVGFGTHRSSGTWILIMLMAEDRYNQERIITDIMERLNISPDRINKIMNDKGCPKCGISLLAHEGNDGKCF